MMVKSHIKAIEYHLPEKKITNDDLLKRFPGIKINDLTRLTGVKVRHVAGENETAADLAGKAAEKLFEKNNNDRKDIDFLILCTSVGDYITPASACILQERLKLPRNCGSFDFNQGCTGFIYGLSLSKGLIESGQARNVLLLTSETISKKIHPLDRSNIAVFGDGAAATLVSATEEGNGIREFTFGTDGTGHETIIIKHGGARFPRTETVSEDYTDEFGNIRNDRFFYMDGSGVFNFSLQRAPEMINELLVKNGLQKGDISLFILQQANRITLEAIFKKLGISKEQEFYCLERWGNTVQSAIPIAIREALDQGRIRKGDKVVMAAFGVGLSWASTLMVV